MKRLSCQNSVDCLIFRSLIVFVQGWAVMINTKWLCLWANVTTLLLFNGFFQCWSCFPSCFCIKCLKIKENWRWTCVLPIYIYIHILVSAENKSWLVFKGSSRLSKIHLFIQQTWTISTNKISIKCYFTGLSKNKLTDVEFYFEMHKFTLFACCLQQSTASTGVPVHSKTRWWNVDCNSLMNSVTMYWVSMAKGHSSLFRLVCQIDLFKISAKKDWWL